MNACLTDNISNIDGIKIVEKLLNPKEIVIGIEEEMKNFLKNFPKLQKERI